MPGRLSENPSATIAEYRVAEPLARNKRNAAPGAAFGTLCGRRNDNCVRISAARACLEELVDLTRRLDGSQHRCLRASAWYRPRRSRPFALCVDASPESRGRLRYSYACGSRVSCYASGYWAGTCVSLVLLQAPGRAERKARRLYPSAPREVNGFGPFSRWACRSRCVFELSLPFGRSRSRTSRQSVDTVENPGCPHAIPVDSVGSSVVGAEPRCYNPARRQACAWRARFLENRR